MEAADDQMEFNAIGDKPFPVSVRIAPTCPTPVGLTIVSLPSPPCHVCGDEEDNVGMTNL